MRQSTAESENETRAEAAETRRVLVVLGMHRSGTSMFTRLLSGLGADMPATLIGASPTNPAGHWESRKIQSLNDEILAALGGHWHDWRSLPEGWETSEVTEGFREEATADLGSEFGDSALFTLKDPRICRLAPFWLSILKEQGVEVAPIIVVRHPLEVATSLEERNRLPAPVGHLLWLSHVLDAEAATRGMRRCIVDYAAVIGGEAEAALTGIAETFGLDWPSEGDPGQLARAVDSRLHHHRAEDATLTGRPDLPEWLGPVWDVVKRWAQSGELDEEGTRVLDEARAGMRAAEPFLGPMTLRAREALLYGDRVRAAEWETHTTRKELAEQIEAHKALQAEMDAIAPEAARAAQELLDLRPRLEEGLEREAQLKADLKGRYDEIVNFSAVLLEMEESRGNAVRRADEASAQAEDAERRLAETSEAMRAREEQSARTDAELADVREQLARLQRSAATERQTLLRLVGALVTGGTRRRVSRGGRMNALLDAVRQTGIFDEAYYLATNPDVAKADIAPLEHFIHYGLAEGRAPNPAVADNA
ncbi:sulfotransferase family protein [Pseudoroseicyclus tamaricis]|uniref:Sulfotransferase family protein n=1 Tax=Pseudoroseicyclus tamaricis TaxID=2705421 RepID=A0A6B2JVV0_9RHOB|nr:hypothetical protein [Pseudoroseicyclus tamaricis]NDV02627.1 hypothetical protein [Pseudoroseicyclus tamaricis]